MFETTLSPRKTMSRGRTIALGVALAVHVTVFTAFTVMSLLAVTPIGKPPVVQIVFGDHRLPASPPAPPPPRDLAGMPARPAPASPPKGPVTQPPDVPVELPTPVPPGESTGPDAGPDNGRVDGFGDPETPDGFPTDPALPAAPTPPPEPPIFRPGKGVSAPDCYNKVKPEYPMLAKIRHLEGTVRIEAVIGVDGSIEDIQGQGPDRLLIDAAVAAVSQWKCKPGRLNGKPVRVRLVLNIDFKLD